MGAGDWVGIEARQTTGSDKEKIGSISAQGQRYPWNKSPSYWREKKGRYQGRRPINGAGGRGGGWGFDKRNFSLKNKTKITI